MHSKPACLINPWSSIRSSNQVTRPLCSVTSKARRQVTFSPRTAPFLHRQHLEPPVHGLLQGRERQDRRPPDDLRPGRDAHAARSNARGIAPGLVDGCRSLHRQSGGSFTRTPPIDRKLRRPGRVHLVLGNQDRQRPRAPTALDPLQTSEHTDSNVVSPVTRRSHQHRVSPTRDIEADSVDHGDIAVAVVQSGDGDGRHPANPLRISHPSSALVP